MGKKRISFVTSTPSILTTSRHRRQSTTAVLSGSDDESGRQRPRAAGALARGSHHKGLPRVTTLRLYLNPGQIQTLRSLRDPYIAVCTLMRNSPQLLADATFVNIQGVMLQFMRWIGSRAHLDPWDEATFVEWLRTKDVLPSTKSTYLKNYIQVRTWSLASPAQQFKAELLRQGAHIPTYQAAPLPPQVLDSPLLRVTHDQRMQIWIMWKTASRCSDFRRMEPNDFVVYDADTLIVDFSNKTKASLGRPFRASRFAVIRGRRTRRLIAWITKKPRPFQWMSTAEMTRVLKTASPEFTAHSIKVGATQVLEWAVAEGRLSLEMKSRLLKHEQRNMAVEMSQRYGRDRVAQALSLKTYQATQLL